MASTESPRPSTRSLQRVAAALLLAFLVPGAGLAGQALQTGHLQSPLVPAGHLRLGFAPSFTSWDSRFGVRTEDGSLIEGEEPLASDLTDPTGTSLFPGLATLARDLEALTDLSDAGLRLGETAGSLTQNVTRIDLSAHVGVFDWLTVGGTLPWVRTRTAAELLFRPDPDANLGLSPAGGGDVGVTAYLESLNAASEQARARAEGICGGGGGGCDAAQALADRAADFAGRAARMYFGSPFFLLAGSSAAQGFSDATQALAAELVAAGLSDLAAPVFSTEAVDAELFASLPNVPSAGIQGSPLEPRRSLWAAGDLEVEAVVRILDGEVRDSGAVRPRLAWTLAGGALVRLPTGTRDDLDLFLDVGTGDGQMDVEGFAYGALRVGGTFTLRAQGRYGIQRSTVLLRRVAPPEAVFPPVSSIRTVEWTPGAYLDLTVSPRWNVSETLALALDYRLFHKGADDYAFVGGGEDPSGLDASLLERETEMTAHQVAVGLRYSLLELWRRGETGAPAELSARVIHAVAGSGGQTPVSTRAELSLRLFRGLWGG